MNKQEGRLARYNKLRHHLLSTPYVLWSIGFIILPLLMIVYYGLTSRDGGGFTLENLKLIWVVNKISLQKKLQKMLMKN